MTRRRIRLVDVDWRRFEDAAYCAYNAVGPEADWDRHPPSKATFVCVIADMVCSGHYPPRNPLTAAEREQFASLSDAAQRRIILAVGP